MKIAFYGSSLVSSYWNGAATYYRGIIRELAARGHEVTFYEPDAYGRQQHRDIDPPPWCRVVVYPATDGGVGTAAAEAAAADVVIKASGVGVYDDDLLALLARNTSADAVRLFWDVDAPATLAAIEHAADAPLRRHLASFDGVLTYGGGVGVVSAYQALGADFCRPVYNAVDPMTHFPVPPEQRFAADLGFLGNRLPDREARVEAFFLEPARKAPGRTFLLGGAGWEDKPLPDNVKRLGHVPTGGHNAFNCTALAVLNVNRQSMAVRGYSPPTRIFEAAGAGACIITDAWSGIGDFLTPDSEILVASDGREVTEHLKALTPQRARAIGERALKRVLAEHTYARRGAQVDRILTALLARKRREHAA